MSSWYTICVECCLINLLIQLYVKIKYVIILSICVETKNSGGHMYVEVMKFEQL